MYGVNSYHLRRLTDNPWNGGAGFSIHDLGDLTPDQVFFRLCDIDMLKEKEGRRTKSIPSSILAGRRLKGRTSDGKLVDRLVGGQSLAQRIREQKNKEK